MIVFFFLLIANHQTLEETARASLFFAAKSLIPILFPFAVLSRFILTASLLPCQNKLLQKTASLFHLSPNLLPAYLLGLFCGFPLGAYAAASLYEAGLCEEKAAHRSASLSNNASVAYLYGAATLFPHPHAAIILLASQTAATLFISLFSQKQPVSFVQELNEPPSYLSLLADAIGKAGSAMLSLASFVVFFAVVTKALLLVGMPPCITLFLEPTSAVRYAAGLSQTLGTPLSLALAAFALGFSGISVILQTQALFHGKIPLKRQLITRLAIAFVSFGISFFTAHLLSG